MAATARSVSFRHSARDRSGNVSQLIRVITGSSIRVGHGESVVPPRLIERVVGDAVVGEPVEVPTDQFFVVSATHLGGQTLADQVSDVGRTDAA